MASRTTTDPIEILLEMGIDLDNLSEEEDYLSALKEAIATILYKTKGKGNEQSRILLQEVVKVRKGRKAADPKFKAKKTKVSGTKLIGTSTIVPKKTTVKKESLLALPSAIEEDESPQQKQKKKRKPKEKNLLAEIAKSVTNIADILKDQYKLKKKEGEFDRKKAQRDKRKLQEAGLEKRFQGLFKTAQKIIEPVRSLFDKIFGFLFNVLLAKFLTKIVDWIANPENQKKIQSIIRFFGDHWKKLLSLYLVFGTGLGKFVLGLSKLLITGAVKLGIAVAKLAAAKGVGGARKLARMLGGKKAKFLIGATSTALTVGGTMMGVNALTGGDGQKTQGFSGGGLAQPKIQPTPQAVKKDSSKGMSSAMKGAALGSMFGPIGAIAGAGIGSLFDKFGKKDDTVTLSKPASVELEVPSGTEGEVDGPGGTDKVPAMLTAGEFVMSRGAVQKFGVKQLEAMNAAGGGTNKPKVVDNKVYASVGGYIGNADLGKKGTPDPEKENKSSSGGGGFFNRFVIGDKSLLNRLALGDTKGALETLGIKIDNNTEAVNQNTDQRKNDSKDFQQSIKQFINNRKKELESAGPGIAGFIADRQKDLESGMTRATEIVGSVVKSRYNPLYAIGEDLTNISKKSYFGEDAIDKLTKERIASGELGEDGLGLTKTTQANLDKNDAYIRSLYDPEKDTGFIGGLKKMNQTIQNKGAILDPLAALGLKEEGTEKFIEKITGGRVKNFGAKLTGIQMAAKGLAGPLGRMFQIDDRGSLGRYLRPAMEEAQRQGHTSVGREALGGDMYDKLVNDKLANLALGQVHFEVDEKGRAKTSDVFDASAMTPKQYLEASRKSLGDAGSMLMGKEVLDAKGNVVQGGPVGIAKALYQSAFMGLSGRLATAQNTGFGNLRPMGLDIDLGGGFTPKKKEVSEKEKQSSMASSMALISGGKDAYYSSTTKRFYANYAEALKDPKVKAAAEVEKVKQQHSFTPSTNQRLNFSIPDQPPANNVQVINVGGNQQQQDKSNNDRGGSQTPQVNAGSGDQGKWKIFGMSWPF